MHIGKGRRGNSHSSYYTRMCNETLSCSGWHSVGEREGERERRMDGGMEGRREVSFSLLLNATQKEGERKQKRGEEKRKRRRRRRRRRRKWKKEEEGKGKTVSSLPLLLANVWRKAMEIQMIPEYSFFLNMQDMA
jgi:hypothetical protein